MSSNALRPDAQAFDKIVIEIVPRYKTSGLSGDEWRISTKTSFYRKGNLIAEIAHGKMEYTVGSLFHDYHALIDDGKAYFAGDGVHCDQEGCDELKTITYLKKSDVCREGHKTEVSDISKYRHFCDKHKIRGNCGLDDADDNYVIVN